LDIRKWLADILPQYAIPTSLTRLNRMPLTPNGKLDRTRLEDQVARARPELSSAHREPGTALEAAVTHLWSDLLELDGIGADDDFFELGGHSLLGVRILGELRRGYGVEISPLAFYLDPTPSGLARAVASARHDEEARHGEEVR
jgi:hypothetical protein